MLFDDLTKQLFKLRKHSRVALIAKYMAARLFFSELTLVIQYM